MFDKGDIVYLVPGHLNKPLQGLPLVVLDVVFTLGKGIHSYQLALGYSPHQPITGCTWGPGALLSEAEYLLITSTKGIT